VGRRSYSLPAVVVVIIIIKGHCSIVGGPVIFIPDAYGLLVILFVTRHSNY